ncbi:MAG: endopeptidase La [Bryobacteraceae bacterium]
MAEKNWEEQNKATTTPNGQDSTEQKFETLPLLPLKNAVLFPGLLMPLTVGRASSVSAVEAALETEDKELVVVTQRDPSEQDPGADELFTIGTKAVIRKVGRSGDDQMDIMVIGIERVVIIKVDEDEPFLQARVRPLPLPDDSSRETEAVTLALVELANKMIALSQTQQMVPDLAKLAATSDDPLRLAFMIASMFSVDALKGQQLLEASTRLDGLRLLHGWMAHEAEVIELRNKINSDARSEISKEQRDYMLRQQMRAIQQELGEKDPGQSDVEELKDKLAKADLPDDIRKEAEREMSRLEKVPPQQPEHNVLRTYLEYVVELPWNTTTEDSLEIAKARRILDEEHFGLKDVKERILEHLAVLKLNPDAKAPILCFVGPPGVGKTSLGQSIAHALGRKFERFSLGGLHDESELRGHRRTYIGAMPGRLIQAMRRVGSKNPVLLLDEVDKLGRDFRGDPAAALLEVLDPEQNKTFRDNYLDLPFDLSKVLFVTTANSLDTIPGPLRDRMEIIRLAGYSEEEKVEIARRYLVPRQLKQTGLTEDRCSLTDEALRKIVSSYTREAGVRKLEQLIGRTIRRVALRIAEQSVDHLLIGAAELAELLGPEVFLPESMRREPQAGVATGLAWTEAGGDVLYIEATLLPDGKGMTLTGQLGDVMQESAKTAQSYVWSHARELGINPALFKNSGIHVHVPAGAIPKDGPSAGVTMVTALASLYANKPARNDTAMTGEVTLTGLVLPIGGVKEKVLAARRTGINRVVLPKANQKDLRDLPEEVRKEMEFIFAERVEDVLRALVPGIELPVVTGIRAA